MSHPKCARCGTTDVKVFGRDLGRTNGFRNYCRTCEAERAKESYRRHREKRTAANRARYQERKAKNLAALNGQENTQKPEIVSITGGDSPVDFDIEWVEPWAPELPPEPKTDPVGIPAAAIVAPEDIPKVVDPLAAAYAEREERREKQDTKKQRDALLDENDRLKQRINELVALSAPVEIIVYQQPKWERMDAVAVGTASDWHVEEPVDKASVHGLNEFNLEIARYRSEKFFQHLLRLTDIQARDSRVTTIDLNFLGDNFSGWIHKELMASALLAPGDAAHFWIELAASGIDFLLRESSYILTGVLIPGNHGRMTDQVHFSDPTGTSLETFAYRSLVKRYEGNPRVRLEVAGQAVVYRRLFERFTMRLIHGYEVKYGGGVGGLTIPLNKAIAQWDVGVRADLTVLGHFHQLFDGGNFIANGSLIGYNTYAQAIKAKFEEPRQAFFLVHARKGGCKSVTAPIWLDDAHHAPEPIPIQEAA